MKLICSFYKAFQGHKDPITDTRETHGVCPACYDWFMQQQDISSLDEYLNTFDSPIIIVNNMGRVLALNKEAEKILGKTSGQVVGLIGGEAMECVYARLPEGCGQTSHCQACTIRNLVQDTLDSKSGKAREVNLTRENEVVSMNVSTDYVDGMVTIQL